MRKLIVILIALVATSSTVKIADGCGDKTMRVGGGLRFLQFEAKKNPSSILIHTKALPAGKASRLQEFLKIVGHKANTFDNVDQLSEAFKAAHYDLVLTDVTAAADMQRKLASVSPKTVVVPVTFKSEEVAAAKQYRVFVKNPKYAEDFLPAVNQVMKARSKNV